MAEVEAARVKRVLAERRAKASASRKPTARQLRVLLAIRGRLDRDGCYPTIRELMADLGFASTESVINHLIALDAKGWVDYTPGGGRSSSRNTFRLRGVRMVPTLDGADGERLTQLLGG